MRKVGLNCSASCYQSVDHIGHLAEARAEKMLEVPPIFPRTLSEASPISQTLTIGKRGNRKWNEEETGERGEEELN